MIYASPYYPVWQINYIDYLKLLKLAMKLKFATSKQLVKHRYIVRLALEIFVLS